MAFYAKIENGEVVNVIVATPDIIPSLEGTWVETKKDGTRKQYAGKGMNYDKGKDLFIERKPFPTWQLDTNNEWKAPKDAPQKSKAGTNLVWNESLQDWEEFEGIGSTTKKLTKQK